MYNIIVHNMYVLHDMYVYVCTHHTANVKSFIVS